MNYKYQEQFAYELSDSWLAGNHKHVRITIRQLKNKAQAAYIAAHVAMLLTLVKDDYKAAGQFVALMHPDN